MNDSAKMVLIMVAVTFFCSALLGGVRQMTKETIQLQRIRYVQGPAIRAVLSGAENDPVADREEMTIGKEPVVVFREKKGGEVTAVALETSGSGYGGELSVVTGFDAATGACTGIAIATSKETPGIGTRVNGTDFTDRFKSLPLSTNAALKKDGGTIDGISGATVSSRAVCGAVAKAQFLYGSINDKVQAETK